MAIVYNGTDSANKLAATDVPFFEMVEMYGYGGNDELKGAFLNSNTIYGGLGDDTIYGGAMGNTLFGDDGNDLINCWQGSYSELFGGSGNDSLTGGNEGNLLDGGIGVDTLRGGDGADIYVVDSLSDQIVETYVPYYDNDPNPRDMVSASISWTLTNNLEDLTLTGSAAINGTGNALNNSLAGNAANNVLNGMSGADTMLGGAGSDTYYVDNIGDRVFETTTTTSTTNAGGTDKVISSVTFDLSAHTGVSFVENLTLTGSTAINGTGNALNNTLVGNGANNVLNGKTGADTMLGGAGNDTYYVDNAGDKVYETTTTTSTTNAGGTDKVNSSITFNLSAYTGVSFVENLALTGSAAINGTGNALNNTLVGNSANNVLNGKTGADTMLGGAGNDTYYVDNPSDKVYETTTTTSGIDAGGTDTVYSYLTSYTLGNFVENGRVMSTGAANLTGNGLSNTIYAGKGNNVLAGGSGTDTLSYAYGANGTTGVKVSLATTAAQATGGSGSDTISGFERLTGSGNNDSLTGNSGANILRGGKGNDTLTGGSGTDTLYGDAGNDLLRGGSGNDILYGGAGKDVFRFDSLLGTSTTPNIDQIKDFVVADDTIQLENSIFNNAALTSIAANTALSSTTTLAGYFRANATGLAQDGNDYLIYETDTGKLFYDSNGSASGGSVQIALLGTNLALTAADFVII